MEMGYCIFGYCQSNSWVLLSSTLPLSVSLPLLRLNWSTTHAKRQLLTKESTVVLGEYVSPPQKWTQNQSRLGVVSILKKQWNSSVARDISRRETPPPPPSQQTNRKILGLSLTHSIRFTTQLYLGQSPNATSTTSSLAPHSPRPAQVCNQCSPLGRHQVHARPAHHSTLTTSSPLNYL